MTKINEKLLGEKNFIKARVTMTCIAFKERTANDIDGKRKLCVEWLKALTPYFKKHSQVPDFNLLERVAAVREWNYPLNQEASFLTQKMYVGEQNPSSDEAHVAALALHGIASASFSLSQSWNSFEDNQTTQRNAHYYLDGCLEDLQRAAYQADCTLSEDTGAMQHQLLGILDAHLQQLLNPK
jgi:hypothetical protein